ncbi:unnamed protein product [Tilletia laevis]|uniref:Uncharacterized protein n=3 Tax=Tilletia TaxID=13289 RepID=A0A9N8LFV8_9BASI|nr:hypothetical protein CF336_g13 [Tilletia laevis]CAD6883886.1 unnamed protein product [Tilletia caries]KAE8208986.1 hypothetical protein CF335_g15 [Tilletia laevis]CAD6902334.1 unnamed protein product [Tilletia laevis]CAD6906722.1 unnamed protein product [Tilletia laevis]
MQALQSDSRPQLTDPTSPPQKQSNSLAQAQEAYVPLPTRPSTNSIQSGFTPGAPIPNNFSYLTRSNSLATSTRPNRPKGLEHTTTARSPQLTYSPLLPVSASVQHFKSTSLQNDATSADSPLERTSTSKHRTSASMDIHTDDSLRRTMHARPPSVDNIFAELEAAEAHKPSIASARASSPLKGSVSRRAADYVATLSASESEPAFPTMRRMTAIKKHEPELERVTPSTDPRKPADTIPVESPTAERVIPRRSKTLSHFPPNKSDESPFHEQRSNAEKAKIAERVAQLPADPKTWLPSQVAVYLSHVLGLSPRPIVDDVTAFVRASRMNGNVFLRLREHDLVSAGVNRKWQKLMLESGKNLRRDCVKCQVWGFGGEGEDEDELGGEERRTANSSDGSTGSDAIPDSANVVDIAALRAGYLKVAPTAVSALRGSVRRIRDRQAVKGMIQAFETWRTEADLCEAEEDAFVALNSGSARRTSFSGLLIDEDSDEDHDQDHDQDEYEDEDGASDVGSTRSHRERETRSIKAIYGAGFVRRRAESYSSLSDADHEMQARIDAEIQGDRSISRARAETRRKRVSDQKADDRLVNAWIESLTDEEAQALANELEAKEILDRGLLKPLIETAALHSKDVSGSSATSTGSVRDDLKLLLGSVNSLTLAQHDLLSVVPALNMHGESSSSAADSPVLEKEAFNADAALGTTEEQEQAARVPHFTTVSPEVLLAIFTETEDDPETIARNVAIEKEIDHFLGISKDAQSSSSSSSQQAIASTPQRREAAALSSRYAVKADDQFDTTRRRKNASYPSGASELMALFPGPGPAPAPVPATAADEVHATVKPGMHAQNLSNASSAADDEFEISPNGSIRRRKMAPSPTEVAEEVHEKAAVGVEERDDDEAAQIATVVLPSSSAAAAAAVAARAAVTEAVESQQHASIRDIFGPMTTIPPVAPHVDAAVPDKLGEDSSSSDSIAKEAEAQPEANDVLHRIATADEPAEGKSENDPAEEQSPLPEDVEASTISKPTADHQSLAEKATLDAIAEADDDDNPASSAPPSMTASKLPTPTLHAKRDASMDLLGDVSGLDLNVSELELEPIEPGGDKIAVPLTVLAPAPGGKGSIKKRSMVLVDRRRFESLARRMGVLESQLAGLESETTSAVSSVAGSQARASTLRGLFEHPAMSSPAGKTDSRTFSAAAHSAATTSTGRMTGDNCSKELADLGREFDQTGDFDDEDLDLLGGGGVDEADEERWAFRFGAPRLSLGAIPSYMLGLGAGIGFVLVSEVIQRAGRFAR